MREIPLTRGRAAIVDDEAFEDLKQYRWYCSSHGYAVRNFGGRIVRMHRQLLAAGLGQIVDHINRDRLDNRKANLRFASALQSTWNSGVRPANSSGFKGVSRSDSKRNWTARIRVNGKRFNLGSYATAIEAAHAYDAAARSYHGEFAKTNFQKDGNTFMHGTQ